MITATEQSHENHQQPHYNLQPKNWGWKVMIGKKMMQEHPVSEFKKRRRRKRLAGDCAADKDSLVREQRLL